MNAFFLTAAPPATAPGDRPAMKRELLGIRCPQEPALDLKLLCRGQAMQGIQPRGTVRNLHSNAAISVKPGFRRCACNCGPSRCTNYTCSSFLRSDAGRCPALSSHRLCGKFPVAIKSLLRSGLSTSRPYSHGGTVSATLYHQLRLNLKDCISESPLSRFWLLRT